MKQVQYGGLRIILLLIIHSKLKQDNQVWLLLLHICARVTPQDDIMDNDLILGFQTSPHLFSDSANVHYKSSNLDCVMIKNKEREECHLKNTEILMHSEIR